MTDGNSLYYTHTHPFPFSHQYLLFFPSHYGFSPSFQCTIIIYFSNTVSRKHLKHTSPSRKCVTLHSFVVCFPLYTIALLMRACTQIVQFKINMILFIQLLRINNSFISVETLILRQSLSVKSKCQNIGRM